MTDPPEDGQQPDGQPYGFAYPQVDKPVGWFIVNWLVFCPTAIYSLIKHWMPMDRAAYVGDAAGVKLHADAIRRLGIWALCIGLVGVVLYVVLLIAVLTTTM